MSGRPRLHTFDGELLSPEEIAGRLGVMRQKLYSVGQKFGVSVAVAARMIRDNMVGTAEDPGPRYLIDGKWMSARAAAEALGITWGQLSDYQWNHRDPETGKPMGVPEAVEQIRHAPRGKDGKLRRGGSAPRYFERIDGQRMCVEEIARKYGVSKRTLRRYKANGRTMAEAVQNYERRRMRKAEREIMEILMGGQRAPDHREG